MQLRLIYFDFPFWRAEASRIALHIGGIPFEDVRPDRGTFRSLKQSGELPFGQLPVLEVDGVAIAQSVAIARFCGTLSGLYPTDPVAAAKVDEWMETANEITGLFAPSMRERDPSARAALRQELGDKTLPHWFGLLEKRAQLNGSSPFLVGEQLTVADLVIWRLLEWLCSGMLDGIPTTLLRPFPKLSAHQDFVSKHPGVQSWNQKQALHHED